MPWVVSTYSFLFVVVASPGKLALFATASPERYPKQLLRTDRFCVPRVCSHAIRVLRSVKNTGASGLANVSNFQSVKMYMVQPLGWTIFLSASHCFEPSFFWHLLAPFGTIYGFLKKSRYVFSVGKPSLKCLLF